LPVEFDGFFPFLQNGQKRDTALYDLIKADIDPGCNLITNVRASTDVHHLFENETGILLGKVGDTLFAHKTSESFAAVATW